MYAKQVSGLWGRLEWSHILRHDCAAASQIQDPALMLGADGDRMGLGKARGTNPLANLFGDMLGRDWCRRGGKRSRYDANLSSSRTCNTFFVDCLVQDAYGNVATKDLRCLCVSPVKQEPRKTTGLHISELKSLLELFG